MSSDDKPKLPQDVVVDILKHLPVESLLRFRCVCRSWRSTIDDPRFVALHFDSSALGASNWHKVCLDWSDPLRNLCSVFSDVSLTLPLQLQIEVPFGAPDNRYVFIGSCNGLICVAKLHEICYDPTIYLWNLFTRKYKVVLLPGLQHQRVDLGFGFDATSNDYKIVRLRDNPGRLGEEKPGVQVYSLRTDSWRSLEWKSLECEAAAFRAPNPAVFFNGSLHWFILKFSDLMGTYVYGSILSFDLAGEVFDQMALPEEFCNDHSELSMAVLNGLLAVFIDCVEEGAGYPDSHSICSVWVMREYGVPESLTKLYTFDVCALVNEFYGFTGNGEVLMSMDGRGLVSWNPITRQFENLPLSTKCDMVTVVESLVSL
ncbi:F-box/kelch-repeat protein At3g06240-like [Rhodamnia argentea]|uniref:F-box/kelch-repeat protein At3g06240-like n=1 Tax=Rhodamnia argentea TaxID=178133 RepID=A0ABM3HCI9_9MYRT|nr:F-box/kelch-repeat protein At3g06240-like [Rhodamnia argentea]